MVIDIVCASLVGIVISQELSIDALAQEIRNSIANGIMMNKMLKASLSGNHVHGSNSRYCL